MEPESSSLRSLNYIYPVTEHYVSGTGAFVIPNLKLIQNAKIGELRVAAPYYVDLTIGKKLYRGERVEKKTTEKNREEDNDNSEWSYTSAIALHTKCGELKYRYNTKPFNRRGAAL